MIDLHLHTTYSDGADSLIELLEKAEELKLECISITDHDTCEGYRELEKLDVKKYYTGEIIKGVEIKCAYNKRLVEILGYNVDPEVINNYMEKFHEEKSKEKLQQKYFDILYDRCINILNLKLAPKKQIEFNPKVDWASVTIYKEIKAHDENKQKLPEDLWQEFNTFSKKYCGNPGYTLYIDKSQDYLSLEEAIKLVKSAGGIAFLAHVFIYKWAEDKKKLLEDLVTNYELDGLECMHSDFSQEEIDYIIDYATKKHLFKSGGSDYHGVNKPGIEMAIGKGNLKIQKDLVKEWKTDNN